MAHRSRAKEMARWLLQAAINPPLDSPSLRVAANLSNWKQNPRLHRWPQKLAAASASSKVGSLPADQQQVVDNLTQWLVEMQHNPQSQLHMQLQTPQGAAAMGIPGPLVEQLLMTSLACSIQSREAQHQ